MTAPRNGARGRGKNRRRQPDQILRDARAVELRRKNLNYDQIAAELGFRSKQTAYAAVQRGLADTITESNDEVRQQELDRLDDLSRSALRIMGRVHYAASGGKLLRHPDTGELLVDDAPILGAIDRLLKIMERRSRLLGLDAPAQVEMVSIGLIDGEIRRLTRELEAAGIDVDAVGPSGPVQAIEGHVEAESWDPGPGR